MTEEKESNLELKIDTLTKVVFELKGAVEANTNGEDILELRKRVTRLEDDHRLDVDKLYELMRQHEKENHSSKVLTQVLINFGTMVATVGAMFLMMKG